MTNTRHFLAGVIGVLIVGVFSLVARFTFLGGGSLFDPVAAPGIGPFALGDILVVAAFLVGYLSSLALERLRKVNQPSGEDIPEE